MFIEPMKNSQLKLKWNRIKIKFQSETVKMGVNETIDLSISLKKVNRIQSPSKLNQFKILTKSTNFKSKLNLCQTYGTPTN